MKNLHILILLILAPWMLQSQTLKTSVFSSGGGPSQSAGYASFGAIGQPLSVGTLGTNFQNKEGFIFAQQNNLTVHDFGSDTICYNSAAPLLTSAVSRAEGEVTYQWQHWSGSAWKDIAGATFTTYDPGALTQTSQFRLTGNDISGVGKIPGETVQITVWPEVVSGTLIKTPANDSVCEGTKILADLTAGNGGNGTDSLQYRVKAGASWSAWMAYNSGDTIPSAGKSQIQVRTWRNGDYCADAPPVDVTWIVSPATIPGQATGGTTVCYGSSSTILTLENYTGSVLGWQRSGDQASWTNIPSSASVTYTATNDTVATWYRAVVSSGACATEQFSDATQITIAGLFTISGVARYENNPKTPLSGLKITLNKIGTNNSWSVNTTNSGMYSFSGLTNGQYHIGITSAASGGQWQTWGGVNMTDYLLAYKHATTGPLLPSLPPVVRISGDVKAPQAPPVINTSDAAAIQMAAKYGWGNPPFFQIPKWVFSGVTGTIDNISLNCADISFNLRGLCAGDVNGSYLPPNGYKIAEPGLALENRGSLPVREEMTFPVTISQPATMGALTLMLNYEPTQIEITGVDMPENAGTPPWFVVENGVLSIGWASVEPVIAREGQPILMIRARLTGTTTPIRFTLNENPLSELADGDGNIIPNVKLTIPDAGSTPSAYCLMPVALYPNPARDILNLEFAMESDGFARVDLTTLQGVTIRSSGNIHAETGMNKVTMNISDLLNGIYLTKVTRNGQVQIQKLVVNK